MLVRAAMALGRVPLIPALGAFLALGKAEGKRREVAKEAGKCSV